MKGLIFVLLMLGLLLISAPETRGQPVPDGGMVSDQEAEDNDMSIIGLMSAPDCPGGISIRNFIDGR